MRKTHHRRTWILALLVTAGLVACDEQSKKVEAVGVGITGIDYLANHLSVQRFSVNGVNAFRAGAGSGSVCCATLPREWQPGMTAKVTWNVTNWRDCTGEDYEAIVPVEKYKDAGHLWVSFLPSERVRVVSADLGPRHPDYPGPRETIPQKYPWKMYPPKKHCRESFQ